MRAGEVRKAETGKLDGMLRAGEDGEVATGMPEMREGPGTLAAAASSLVATPSSDASLKLASKKE